jgi:hypothetical protein
MPSIYQVREKFEVYDLVQSTLLSIPGHALYFANELAEARKKIEKPWLDNNYQLVHQQVRDTLIHLPSPETILVLGTMLESKEDIYTRDEIVAIWKEVSNQGGYRPVMPTPSGFAFGVLQKIGLLNYPVSASESMTAALDWWRQVKSGDLTFSFKGQAVEYRFRPDGTWETIPIANPPDDGPKTVLAAPDSGKRDESPATVDSVKPADRSMWWWIAGVAGVLLAVALALFIILRRTG